MTGPEHYRKAEQLLASAKARVRPRRVEACEETGEAAYTSWPADDAHEAAVRERAEAQVHATLALAAAQLDRNVAKATGATVPEFHDWADPSW